MSVPDWVLGSIYLFGGGTIAALLAFSFATNRRRVAVLLGLGAVVGVAFVLLAYFSAPTGASESNCSDCGYYGGRYWEPQLVVAILVWNLAAWLAAVLAGAAVRRTMAKRRISQDSEVAWR